jgi:hypothetical protein
MKLFDDEWGVDNSQIDNTEIVMTILYFSAEESKTFKALCKKAMKVEFPDNYQTKANISDLLLIILKQRYENL